MRLWAAWSLILAGLAVVAWLAYLGYLLILAGHPWFGALLIGAAIFRLLIGIKIRG